METEFEIFWRPYYYKNYFHDFILELDLPTQHKVFEVLNLIITSRQIPKKFFRHLSGTKGLYEIQVEYNSNIYRVFCFFDKGRLIVLINGFNKKSQKTPGKEIEKALKLKQQYETEESESDHS